MEIFFTYEANVIPLVYKNCLAKDPAITRPIVYLAEALPPPD